MCAKKSLIVGLQGGLGNQMFQFAHGLTLSRKTNRTLGFSAVNLLESQKSNQITPREFALGEFDVTPVTDELGGQMVIDSTGENLLKRQLLVESTPFRFEDLSGLLDPQLDAEIRGYWQSFKYFSEIQSELQEIFSPKAALPTQTQRLLDEIQGNNSVGVHVRRGDYAKLRNRVHHGLMPKSFYNSAWRRIMERAPLGAKTYIFSDDPAWCSKSLHLDKSQLIVPPSLSGPNSTHHLELLKATRNVVISNSSFAWWAAYLGQAQTVIAPSRWYRRTHQDFSDLLPSEWLKI